MFPFPDSPGFERGTPYTTHEKVGIQLSLYDQIEQIRNKLSELSRIKKQLPRRDLHEKWEEIDDLVESLLSRAVVLSEPRGVNINRIIGRNPPRLVAKGRDGAVLWREWYTYIRTWMQHIVRILDEAQLLLTEQQYDPDWVTPLQSDAETGVWPYEDFEDEDEDEDSAPSPLIPISPDGAEP